MASTGSSSLGEEELDCRGLKCPLPVLHTEKRLAQLSPGGSLTVLATDPVAKIDIPLFCTQHGHMCEIASADGAMTFRITKGKGA